MMGYKLMMRKKKQSPNWQGSLTIHLFLLSRHFDNPMVANGNHPIVDDKHEAPYKLIMPALVS
jgi:hypothetical protein